jgi:integrase
MAVDTLSDLTIRRAKPKKKAFVLADGRGLGLYVSPAGARLWRFRYLMGGKPRYLTFGSYPSMPLAEARKARDTAREQVRDGLDPALVMKAAQDQRRAEALDTFEALAREWHALQKSTWTPVHAADVLGSLEKDIFPAIGALPVRGITAPMVLAELRKIEARPAIETARRVRQRMSAVFVYAIASGRGEADPAAIVQNAMAPLKKGRQPAITALEDVRKILRAVEAIPSFPVTKLAMRLIALTALRPGVLVATPWDELPDLAASAPVWTVPSERMKLRLHLKGDERRDHLVPLAPQAVEVIEAVKILTRESVYLFPNGRFFLKPMSENALGYALNRAGYHHRHVPHGWRSSFSTIMNERHPEWRAVIDLMLAHVPKNDVESAYNRAAYLEQRRAIALEWADLLMKDMVPAAALLKGARRR